jgi:hypothetical protein
MEPEDGTARAILQRKGEARELRIVRGLVFLAQAQEEIERRDGLVRRAHVQDAGEVGEIVSHDGLLSE